MPSTEFGVSIEDELVEDLDELTEQCIDLQASRSEVVEAVLTLSRFQYLNGGAAKKPTGRERQ